MVCSVCLLIPFIVLPAAVVLWYLELGQRARGTGFKPQVRKWVLVDSKTYNSFENDEWTEIKSLKRPLRIVYEEGCDPRKHFDPKDKLTCLFCHPGQESSLQFISYIEHLFLLLLLLLFPNFLHLSQNALSRCHD